MNGATEIAISVTKTSRLPAISLPKVPQVDLGATINRVATRAGEIGSGAAKAASGVKEQAGVMVGRAGQTIGGAAETARGGLTNVASVTTGTVREVGSKITDGLRGGADLAGGAARATGRAVTEVGEQGGNFIQAVGEGQRAMRDPATGEAYIGWLTSEAESMDSESQKNRLAKVLESDAGKAAVTELVLTAIKTGGIAVPKVGWAVSAGVEMVQKMMTPNMNLPPGEEGRRLAAAQEASHQACVDATLSYLVTGRTDSGLGKKLNPANFTPEQLRKVIDSTPLLKPILTKAGEMVLPMILKKG